MQKCLWLGAALINIKRWHSCLWCLWHCLNHRPFLVINAVNTYFCGCHRAPTAICDRNRGTDRGTHARRWETFLVPINEHCLVTGFCHGKLLDFESWLCASFCGYIRVEHCKGDFNVYFIWSTANDYCRWSF